MWSSALHNKQKQQIHAVSTKSCWPSARCNTPRTVHYSPPVLARQLCRRLRQLRRHALVARMQPEVYAGGVVPHRPAQGAGADLTDRIVLQPQPLQLHAAGKPARERGCTIITCIQQ